MIFNSSDFAWEKMNGLIPVIVQDSTTSAVLMLGYMNQEALQKTLATSYVTFFSRTKNSLWTKGETSGNKLKVVDIIPDCDKDTLLIRAIPEGPVCHTGLTNCFGEINQTDWGFIQYLEAIIDTRYQLKPPNSYTAKLIQAGISRIAQKVGEECVEVILAAVENDADKFNAEVADLIFHILILLRMKNQNISKVINILKARKH